MIEAMFEEAEPDGRLCGICKEPVFLKAWRFCIRPKGETVWKKDRDILCDGCKTNLESGPE